CIDRADSLSQFPMQELLDTAVLHVVGPFVGKRQIHARVARPRIAGLQPWLIEIDRPLGRAVEARPLRQMTGGRNRYARLHETDARRGVRSIRGKRLLQPVVVDSRLGVAMKASRLG